MARVNTRIVNQGRLRAITAGAVRPDHVNGRIAKYIRANLPYSVLDESAVLKSTITMSGGATIVTEEA